jgi:hypothetical protein
MDNDHRIRCETSIGDRLCVGRIVAVEEGENGGGLAELPDEPDNGVGE